ncbi:MAG TPA: hypothetical protein VMW50_02615 [Dehalococcoidia bacterium]|nr:hypothetical protein [Dehalococcoidia bacterium]
MKKIGLLCLALVLALGAMGVGYSLWSDSLYVDGSIETGSLCWEWTGTYTNDPGPPNSVIDWTCRPGFEGPPLYFWPTGKDVGYTDAVVIDSHTIELTMVNVYPCYFVAVSVYARNCGTIPLHFERVIIRSDYGEHIIDWIQADRYPAMELDLDGDGAPDIEFSWGNHIGDQLHPGDDSGEISFWIHVMQPAPQGAVLTFQIILEAVQYNESIHPIPAP